MLFCYCNFGGNLGDRSCSPKMYFPEWYHEPEMFPTSDRIVDEASTGPIIIGGGGMFMDGCEPLYARFATLGRPVIVWGAGVNSTVADAEWQVPEALNRFALVGVRDYGQALPYVPCASCLHESFNLQWPPKFKYMVYEHYQWPIPIETLLKIGNHHCYLWQAVRYLLSANTVITNSFHGAYWGMLLGRRVLVYKPPSNKFRFLKHQPEYVDETNWQEKLEGPPTAPPHFLAECRQLNWEFYKRVKELVDAA